MAETRLRLGADRVLEPENALPQGAERLDPSGPVRPYEIEVAVESLFVDATSYRNLRERAGDDPALIADLVRDIVVTRGKMHNAETNSGGILVGVVTAIGEGYPDAPPIGARVVPMCSLSLGALSLDHIGDVELESPEIPVKGTSYFRAPCAVLPDDIPERATIDLLEVSTAASQIRNLVPQGGTICVLGAGNGGKLALATARREMKSGTVVAVDIDPAAIKQVVELGLCDIGVVTDLQNPLAALEDIRAAGAEPADLTVVVTNTWQCEPTALLLTAEGGTVLFFSVATSFGAAALAGDGIGTELTLLIGSAYSHDPGSYALDLYRQSPALRKAFGQHG